MQLKLKFFLIIICLIFDLFVYKKVEKGNLQLKYSFMWYVLSFILIFVTIFDGILNPLKLFLGFETISNMVFLMGFFLLTLITFSINLKLSEQNVKIIKLTQEVALLKKEIKKNDKSNKKNL